MSEGQPSQPVIIVASTKSMGIGIILALLFGPLGLLYSSVLAAIVMFVITIVVAIFTVGLGLLFTNPICAVWAAIAVSAHNKKLLGSAYRQPTGVGSGAVTPPVFVSAQSTTMEARTTQEAPQSQMDSMFCQDCGAEGLEDNRFCGKCGGQLRAAVESVDTSQGAPEGFVETAAQPPVRTVSSGSVAIYASVVAALVVLAAAGYWWMHRHPRPSAENALVGTWQYGSEKGFDSSGKNDPIGYLRIVRTSNSQFQFSEGFPCAEAGGPICWHPDGGLYLDLTNGKLTTTIQSYNFRATHAVVFDYELAVERVDENHVLYTVKSEGLTLQETHMAHRISLVTNPASPSEIVPTTRKSVDAAPNVTEPTKESKRLNAEGIRNLSAANPDLNDAKRAFDQAVQLDPNNVEALNNLGYVYSRLGDYSSAEPILIRVIDLAPKRKVAYGNLGQVQAKLGKTQDAANNFCRYVRQFSSLERGKSILARTFNDPDPNVQSVVNSTLANCN